jgi:hypothetical protein
LLVPQDRDRGIRVSSALMIWTYAFVTTVFLGSNGFVFARWPDPELGRMISEAAFTAPGVVGMEFAPWTFWAPMAASVLAAAAMAASAFFIGRRTIGTIAGLLFCC